MFQLVNVTHTVPQHISATARVVSAFVFKGSAAINAINALVVIWAMLRSVRLAVNVSITGMTS